MKNISIKSILKELYEQEETTADPQVEFPEWLENKLRTVHGEPGQGSIFADPNSVKDAVLDVIEQNKDRIAEVASTTGTIKTDVSGIGYDLVIPTEEARELADAVMGETEKVEGPNRFRVPMVRTSAPLSDFATDQLTVVVRPKKDQSGAVIPNQYIILSAFPGKDLPRTSEWNGKYAVVIPEQSAQTEENLTESFTTYRWKRLANIIKD